MSQFVIGLDIGGTLIKGGLFDLTGSLLAKASQPTDSEKGLNGFLDSVLTLVDQLSRNLPQRPIIGIGVAGILDFSRTILIESPNLQFLNGIALRNLLMHYLSTPILLENDANCAALGELWVGSGKELDSFLLYTIGTGIGGGLVLNRKLWTGEKGKAGEFGHMIVNPNGALCKCGKKGCLEAEASGSAIVRLALDALRSGSSTRLRHCVKDKSDFVTPEQVYNVAREGDPLCLNILCQCAEYLAVAMSNVNNLLDIHHFIIGGGVGTAMSIVQEHLVAQMQRMVFSPSKGSIRLLMAYLGNDAGMYGAGFLARQFIEEQQRDYC